MQQTYLFTGDDEYLKDEKLKDLKETYIEKPAQALNYNIFYASQTDIGDVIQTAKTAPFLNPKRIVVLKDLQNLESPSDQQHVLDYLKNPTNTTMFILVTSKNETTAFISEISKYARVFRLNKLNFTQLSNWMQKGFSVRKKRANKDVIDILIETQGNDLARLENCIEKISLYVGSRFIVERQDVEAVVGKAISSSVFDLVDTIIKKDSRTAVLLAGQLIKSGKKVPAVINAIFRQFEKIFLAKRLLLYNKLSKQTTAAKLGINRFFIEKFFNQVNSFTENQLKDKFRLILWADLKAKTTGIDPYLILELLVTKLCLGKEAVDLYGQA